MSDFKAKTHQIRFQLGLRPRPRWEVYSAPPDPLAGFRGPILLRGEGRKGGEGREERGGDGRGGVDPQTFAEMTPLYALRTNVTRSGLHLLDNRQKAQLLLKQLALRYDH